MLCILHCLSESPTKNPINDGDFVLDISINQHAQPIYLAQEGKIILQGHLNDFPTQPTELGYSASILIDRNKLMTLITPKHLENPTNLTSSSSASESFDDASSYGTLAPYVIQNRLSRASSTASANTISSPQTHIADETDDDEESVFISVSSEDSHDAPFPLDDLLSLSLSPCDSRSSFFTNPSTPKSPQENSAEINGYQASGVAPS